jgi:3-isopropylmalate/(R)-2-methylmalate dehydratase small subunit
MEKFTTLEGVAAPLKMINVDTDMVIPKQYLKTIKRTGLGKGLFSEMRYKDDGSENPDFVLNKPAYRKSKILVAGDNPLRDLDLVRRHLLQQLLQERRAADPRLA